jgi:nitric oxide reductase NorD protein
MSIFEPEETVGKYWHRLIGSASTYRHHPEAAVPLEAVRTRIGVMFRALGGSGAIRIVSGAPMESGHRLNLKQRMGLGREKLDRAIMDESTLRLPAMLDVFPHREENEALYEWLAAWFAHAVPPKTAADDPLRNDLLRLRATLETTRATLQRWPGLEPLYRRLCAACLAARPKRWLPTCEAALETVIESLLGGTPAKEPDEKLVAAIRGTERDLSAFTAPNGYSTFLPVPVWGEVAMETGGAHRDDTDEEGGHSVHVDQLRRRAIRHPNDQSQRGDPLLLHRFETIFSIAEMVNVNRNVEDEDEEGAREALNDLPELTIGSHHKRTSTRLKLDLELAPAVAETESIVAEITYPEWDWKRQIYRPDYCRVVAGPAPETGEDWVPDAEMQKRIRQVRRQFEALRPKRQIIHGEPDGHDLDLSALVRDLADRRAGGPGTERVFVSSRTNARDLSLAVLMDVSLSTDAWLDGRRVLDVEKSALLALTHGLTACGDEHAVFTFTSRRRGWVNVSRVKDFDEDLNPKVIRRIQALRPGQYTRMGAAVRHVLAQIAERPQRHRLILILTDGKPNDIDHYEGRYGIEDTRMAIREAREAGIRVFGVTVDEHARDYFPYIFGRGAYAIFPSIARLPTALPAIYRQITH